ncbi:MAG: GNAT family N-acetyltransferase [Candidatus Dormibacteria bacterium]
MREVISHSFIIRAAVLSDARAMAVVHISAWRAAYRGLLPDSVLDGLSIEESEQRWDGMLRTADETLVRYLVAEDAVGAVLGISGGGSPRDEGVASRFGELRMLNVAPASWGCGVGRALLAACEHEIHALGYSEAYLWVLEGNARARRLYRHAGWLETSMYKADNRFPGQPREVQYRRHLTRDQAAS